MKRLVIPAMRQLAQLIRRIPVLPPGLALFCVLAGWYVLTMSGHTYTSDEETMLAVAENLLKSGTFALEPDFLMNYAADSADGRHYSRYGPGQSLVVVPFLLVGQLVAHSVPPYATGLTIRLFVLLLPALVTAATGLALFAWIRAIGYSARIAMLVGLLYGLSSLAWPYSRTLFAEPLSTLLLVVCAAGIQRERAPWWAAAGAAAACAVAVKAQALLALPLLAGYALLVSWRGDLPESLRRLAGRAAFGLAGAALPLALWLLYNVQIFGHPLATGYGGINPSGELGGTPWAEGLYGLTISTGKGLLFFSPTVLLGLIGLGCRLRQQWRESLLAVALLVAHLAFYSRILYWHGDGSWGPRYMVFVVPFLLLPAAGLLAVLANWRSRVAYTLAGGLVLLSFLIQMLPVLVNMNTYMQLSGQYERFFRPSASPLVGHARVWAGRVDEWWGLRVAPPDGVAVLREGFSYSEGDRTQGELLPRWTSADARIYLYPRAGEPLSGRIVAADHRPWPLERANFVLLLDEQPLEGVQRTDLTGENIIWELRFQLGPDQARRGAVLNLHSDTWNPTFDTEDNPRNEDLGLLLESSELTQNGQPLALREALPIPRPTSDRRGLWLWYYDTPNHHLLDVWLWYLLVADLPAANVALLVGLIGLPALAALAAGLRGLVPVLRGQPASTGAAAARHDTADSYQAAFYDAH